MSTIDGGMICPSVPAAQMEPHAISGSYPRLSMVGSDRSPMVTTVAPTIPVEAASSAPTHVTAIPRPARIPPSNSPIVVSSSSAIRERSSMTPMKTNNGTAIRRSFVMIP